MKGPVKYFNTKDDINNALMEYPDETKQKLAKMLEEVNIWETKEIVDDKAVVENAEKERIIQNIDEDLKISYVKQELIVDQNNFFARIGLDLADVRKLVE